jgi:3-hydroxyisobutyrate dehydrogenase-like beta-hydroxyacid dehydrogenase
MKTGFVGLGNLGLAIAENLLASQRPLYLYNRTAAKARPLVEKGAVLCGSLKEMATQCDVVFSIVSDDQALEQITKGPEGLAAHLRPNGIHVSLSTILPATSESLHALHREKGSHYLACPVMARPEVARARKINFLISGDAASITTVKPLLVQAGATGVWEFGDQIGAANVAKLASNYLVLMAMVALGEGINLAQRSQIDTELWMRMLTETYFNAPVYKNYSRLILDEAYLPASFTLDLGLKDMNLVLAHAARAQASMPGGEQARTLLSAASSSGLGQHDVTAVAKWIMQRPASMLTT